MMDAPDRANTVLYLGPPEHAPIVRAQLGSGFEVLTPELSATSVAAHMHEAVAILDASMRVKFDREMLDRAPALKVVATATTGADHIDDEALAERGIPLLTLRGERHVLQNLTPAAELSWLLLMACARGFRGAVDHVLEGRWIREEFPGVMLRGKELGLIGCGRIGSWMARYASAFGMRVCGYDPFAAAWPEAVTRSDLDDLLSRSDFVSLHVPLNATTLRMIGERELSLMKSGAILVNTSRGAIVDEDALLRALLSGRLRGAGLDVLEGEPDIDTHPLVVHARTHSNLILTPHIGGFSPDAVKLVVEHAARRIAGCLGYAAAN
jgi:D-3-phosphoglycerate dehydrogenase